MLTVTGLTVGYTATPVLHDLSFTVPTDAILAVVGPSGAGKTTLLRALTQTLPFTGTVTLNDQPLSVQQHTLALVPQDYGLLPWRTVRQNVLIATRIRQGRVTAATRATVTALLDALGIAAVADAYPQALSGGQAQRAALARAFALQPDLILLDEAFSALDPVVKQRAYTLFLTQWQTRPTSTLLITHDLEEALQLADHLLILHNGLGRGWPNPLAAVPRQARSTTAAYYPTLAALREEVTHAWTD
ncbi:ATP-binding cassette domain-containing protein [Lacticaseibacillus absianus]|uniref:ATP-binding cassette domain-containing protein n=1 Tax=Lacticaseibacillus absianus TaxID=2729623 RepID=UPI0015CC6B75|nr:ATP-binding cassette domain-containing protein [Lacticaseibacillus absianus]